MRSDDTVYFPLRGRMHHRSRSPLLEINYTNKAEGIGLMGEDSLSLINLTNASHCRESRKLDSISSPSSDLPLSRP
jgi:hypothetical protein